MRCVVISFCLIFVVAVHEAQGALITFNFEAMVTQVISTAPELNQAFSPSQPISGSYTFESSTLDGVPTTPTWGVYTEAVQSLNVTVGTYTATLGGPVTGLINRGIQVQDNNPADHYSVIVPVTGPIIAGAAPYFTEIHLSKEDGTLFSTDALPIVPPSLSGLDIQAFVFGFQSETGPGALIFGTVTSMTPVPLPPAFILFAIGLSWLARTAKMTRGSGSGGS